jgi:hypothetical protein
VSESFDLAAKLERRLNDRTADDFAAMTSAPPKPDYWNQGPTLTGEQVAALVRKLEAERRWLQGRPVKALKVGRLQLEWLRLLCADHPPRYGDGPAALFGGLTDTLFGIPVYEADAADYYEPIYEDEAPTLEALNERLLREPRAVGGNVEHRT